MTESHFKEDNMNVAVMKWTGPETVAKALETVDAWKDFQPGMKVLIKPNAVMGGSPKISCRGITTSPVVVEEIVRIVHEKGAGSVVVAEGSVELPTLKLDTNAAYHWSGLQAVSEKKGILLIDLNKGPYRTFTLSDGTQIDIAGAVFDADFVINVPILKTHNQTTTTICLKNLKGCLSMESKKVCHVETDLNRAIAEFNRFIPCHVNVVDALTATEIGPTPTGREDQVRELGLLLAGKDRLACDIVGSFLLGYGAENIPHIKHYAELTDCRLAFEDISIIGEDPVQYRLELEYVSDWAKDLMEKYDVDGMHMPYYGNSVCSACGFNLWAGMFGFCRAHKGLRLEGVELCLGKDVTPNEASAHPVLLGKCAIESNRGMEGAIKIPGCPPDPGKMAEIMTRELVSKAKK
jgi:uncharacterized protein (DUF362 family)